MSEDDHKYYFGCWPEAPWKSEEGVTDTHVEKVDVDNLLPIQGVSGLLRKILWRIKGKKNGISE